jgi:hypothetical protein
LSTDDLKIKFKITYYILQGRIKYFKSINHFRTKYNLELKWTIRNRIISVSYLWIFKINQDDNIDAAVEILDNLWCFKRGC